MSLRDQSNKTIFIFSSLNMLVVALQGIVLVPLYLRYVGSEVYGAWISTGDILIWMQALDFGVSNYAIQMMSQAHAEGNKQILGEWFSSILAVMLGVGLLALIGGLLVNGIIYKPFHLPSEQVTALKITFMLGVAATSLTLVSFALVGLSRATHSPKVVMIGTLAASIIGALTAVGSLFLGAGILSAGYAMLSRSIVIVLSCLFFLHSLGKSGHFRWVWNIDTLRQLLRMMPSSALGSLSYALGTQSDTLIAGYLFGPEVATNYMVNRRAADVGKSLLDTLTYSSFASLAGEHHANPIAGALMFRGLLLRQALLSLTIMLGYILLNKVFLHYWVGERFFLGEAFTVLVAVQVLASSRGYFLNSAVRAVSVPKRAYNQLAGELLTKLALVVVTYRFGLEALLVSGSIAALIWGLIWAKDCQRLLGYTQWIYPMSLAVIMVMTLLSASLSPILASGLAVLGMGLLLLFIYRDSRYGPVGSFMPQEHAETLQTAEPAQSERGK